jgi:hypothetical protein
MDALVLALQKLDHLNDCILRKPNTNRDEAAIKEAAYYKKRFIIGSLLSQLPKQKKLLLLVRLRQWRRLYDTLRKVIHPR